MTALQPPSYLQAADHPASTDRLTVMSLLAPGQTPLTVRGGVRPSGVGTELAVTVTGTGGTSSITIQPGTVHVPAPAGQGVYVCHNDAAVTRNVGAASPSQSRIDLVVAQVYNAETGGIENRWEIDVVAGTPTSGTPVAPAVPASAWPLAEVRVRAGGTTSVIASDITDRRGVRSTALGGVVPTTSTALPANPHGGLVAHCRDVSELRVWNTSLSAWERALLTPVSYGGEWTTYSPAITGTSGGGTVGNAVFNGGPRYKIVDRKTVHVAIDMTLGNTTSFGNGTVEFTLPVPARAVQPAHIGSGLALDAASGARDHLMVELNAVNKVLFVTSSGQSLSGSLTVPFGWGTGDSLRFQATYESA